MRYTYMKIHRISIYVYRTTILDHVGTGRPDGGQLLWPPEHKPSTLSRIRPLSILPSQYTPRGSSFPFVNSLDKPARFRARFASYNRFSTIFFFLLSLFTFSSSRVCVLYKYIHSAVKGKDVIIHMQIRRSVTGCESSSSSCLV